MCLQDLFVDQKEGIGDEVFCFDDIVVDAKNFRVQKSGVTLGLTPRAFDVLVFLVRRGGRVVEKQEIFDGVWAGTFVSDNALTKVIKEVRHVLGDPAESPKYIETVQKRGYRFIGDIVPVQTPDSRPIANAEITVGIGNDSVQNERSAVRPRLIGWRSGLILASIAIAGVAAFAVWSWSRPLPIKPIAPVRSIAVLPFHPLSADSRDESLEMGMAETLATRLGNLKQLVVRPATAVSKYAGLETDPVSVGKELKVEAVLDGSIQKAGDRVRVTVRMIDVRTGGPIWSEQFDESFTDIFKVQDSIAERVTSALALELSSQERRLLARHLTENPEAYQLYLRGQLIWNGRRQNWIEQSLALYRQALEKDPEFALAHIGVADAYIMLNGHHRMSADETEKFARPAVIRALEIDETLAQAHNALAELKYQFEFDWAGAETEFRTAIDLNPNVAWIHQAYGWFLMSAARFDEATVEMEKAHDLDPSSLTINVGRGRLYYYARQYDQSLVHFQNIIAVEPGDASSYFALYTVYKQKKMYPEAVDIFLKYLELDPRSSPDAALLEVAYRTRGWNGFVQKQLELLEKRQVGKDVEAVAFANLYATLGQKEEALYWLGRSFENREPGAVQFKIEPSYDLLHDDPRFVDLIRKIGLEP